MTETASIDAPIVRLVAPDGTAVGEVEVGLSENERRELLRLMIRRRNRRTGVRRPGRAPGVARRPGRSAPLTGPISSGS
jgi:hypothetical protein